VKDFSQSNCLRKRFHAAIPGGAHTYARGDDQFPEGMAPYITHGAGCRVWDVDHNEYIEYGMGLRSVTLGHAYPAVVEATIAQIPLGVSFCRPSVIELECAEAFLDLVRTTDMVKFTKNGSDATTAAIKLARAYTNRDMIGICLNHPFFSFDDWFIGSTSINAGIPRCISDLNAYFRYDDIDSVELMFREHKGQIACIILEAERDIPPSADYLATLKAICEREGALLIFDEIVTGFRWSNGGAQAVHGIKPHLSTWGKAMGNGFPIAALAGERQIMDRGGLFHGDERVFLLSTTYGGEAVSLAATLATMRVYATEDVIGHLEAMGKRLRDGANRCISKHGLDGLFEVRGRDSCLFYITRDGSGEPSQALRTLFLQEMLDRSILAPSFIVSYSHHQEDIDETIQAVDESLHVYAKAIAEGYKKFLRGQPVKPVYRSHN
jgi:glutamate-1-semialdehyde 2,1-aminomutase